MTRLLLLGDLGRSSSGFFASTRYTDVPAAVDALPVVSQSRSTLARAITTALLDGYVDPRQVTAAEAEEFRKQHRV
jgi:hypothetical protein